MKVVLMSHTPNPDYVVAAAAHQCYSADEPDIIMGKLNHVVVEKRIAELFAKEHHSPFEHVSFTFGISGVSRALSHQLVRHRISSFSQKSQRYVKEGQFEYVIPTSIQGNKEAEKIFIAHMEETQRVYNQLYGMKIPAEDARYVLTNSCTTSVVMTINARSLFNYFSVRACTHAQWEIRALANEMLKLVVAVAPNIFAKAGPKCKMQGRCTEGNKDCFGFLSK